MKKLTHSLYVQVIVAILIGVVLGHLRPSVGASMRPLGDGFIKLVKMLIAPIIFLTVVQGIAHMGDLKKVGRVGAKGLIYFEVFTTVALAIGLLVANILKPGAGMNINPATLDTKAISVYTTGKHLTTVDFIMNIIPKDVADAFAKGDILQILLFAILFGCALAYLKDGGKLVMEVIDGLNKVMFRIVAMVMRLAPVGAFGAMAFTVGAYGLKSLVPLAKLIGCFYFTSALFVILILGSVLAWTGLNMFKFLRYILEEILIVLGTSSSESALPLMMEKMERLGCSKSVVGMVIPMGYSFNLDGTSIYLTLACLFIAQATNTHVTFGEQLYILAILLLTSKGAAAVTGGGFITLAATLSVVGNIPVAGLALLLGIDKFMSECRAITNLIGNGVASVVVSKWEGELDLERAKFYLNNPKVVEDELRQLHTPVVTVS